MKTLKDLFLDGLADIYDAEGRIAKSLLKMAEAAVSEDLKTALEDHLEETRGHAEKLKKVFACFDQRPRGKTCEATVGLLKEGDAMIADFKDSPALDAALIAIAQKVEHYEIATYGCLREWALSLDNEQASELIQEILEEEEAANQTLTEIAESESNEDALGDIETESSSASGGDGERRGDGSVPAGVGGQPENDEDAKAAGLRSATDTRPSQRK